MNKLQTKRPIYLPRIGQRIVKTSIAVLITLLVYYLRGYRGADMPAEAAITAIICMQPYVHDTREYAMSRFIGTLIGAAWGLGFLLLMLVFPRMGEVLLLVYLRMAVGVMLTLYTCVLVRRPDTAGQAAIVFICVVIAFRSTSSACRGTRSAALSFSSSSPTCCRIASRSCLRRRSFASTISTMTGQRSASCPSMPLPSSP